ncbi:MAG: hypothetical protein R2942_11885 [Ignavibacteria bacterium]
MRSQKNITRMTGDLLLNITIKYTFRYRFYGSKKPLIIFTIMFTRNTGKKLDNAKKLNSNKNTVRL